MTVENEDIRILSLAEVAALIGVRRETILRWRQRGIFPEPRQIGPKPRGKVGYLLADIEKYLNTTKPHASRRKVG